MYLVRRCTDNTVRTIMAHSLRGAMIVHCVKYPQVSLRDDEFLIKERGALDWEIAFRVTAPGSFRKLPYP